MTVAKTKKKLKLPDHVEMAMRDAGLGPDARDERGLMPLARARAWFRGLETVKRGKERVIDGVWVWESDISWAALLSLAGPEELVKKSPADWRMPPRGLDNPAVAERYGDGAIAWVARMVAEDGGPGFACLAATLLAAGASKAGFEVALALDASQPRELLLWRWLEKHPKGWAWLAADVKRGAADRCAALQRLAKTDAKGAFLAIAAADGEARAVDVFARAKVKPPTGVKVKSAVKGRTSISIGVLEPHFSSFEYPMWDNMNYFAGAMRVTGFVCARGEALVWEQLATGLGDGGARREVTVHASFPVRHSWRVHTTMIMDEAAVVGWEGEDMTSLLTGVRRTEEGKYVRPPEGIKTQARVPGVAKPVSLAIDFAGVKPSVAKLVLRQLGPVERLLVRLGQAHRASVFPKLASLAKEAKLPADARALFSFDQFALPDACEPAASSADIVAMVDALAARTRLERLPSHGLHPLHGVIDRCKALGGFGDAKLCG